MIKNEPMIESIIIKNKKGDKIELDFDELCDLKLQLERIETVRPSTVPGYYPTKSPDWPIFPNCNLWQWISTSRKRK